MKNIGLFGWLVILGIITLVSTNLTDFAKKSLDAKKDTYSPDGRMQIEENGTAPLSAMSKTRISTINELETAIKEGLSLDKVTIDCKKFLKDFETVFVTPTQNDDEPGFLQIMEKNEVLYDAMLFVESPSSEEWAQLIQFTETSIETAKNTHRVDDENYMFYKSMMIFAPKFMVWVGEKEIEFDLSKMNICFK